MSISGFVSTVSPDGPLAKQRAIRVVVADDHPIVRYALRQILTLTGEIEVVGESAVGQEVLRVVTHTQADIVLIDLRMSDSQIRPILQALAKLGTRG